MSKLLIILLMFPCSAVYSQDSWVEIEVDLWKQRDQKKITRKEWYQKIQVDAGVIPNSLSAWYKSTTELKLPENKGIYLRFEKDFLLMHKSGSASRKMVLVNDTDSTLFIQRIDATIGFIKEFFLIDGKWLENKRDRNFRCGNGFYKQALNPFSQIEFELSNGTLLKGDIEVDYKIVFIHENQSFESNVIKVKLYKNQIKRLKEKST